MEVFEPPTTSSETVMVVFDLDACCWYPEMYQLWGGGAPFEQLSTAPNNRLHDRRKTPCRMLGDVASCFAELHRRMGAGEPLLVGVASRSDEPSWARECLRKFVVADGVSMMDVVTEGRCEIYKASSPKAIARRTAAPPRRAWPEHSCLCGADLAGEQAQPLCCPREEVGRAVCAHVFLRRRPAQHIGRVRHRRQVLPHA